MPGLEQTGPEGLGQMTGGARGKCNPRGRFKKAEGIITSQGKNRDRGRRNRNRGTRRAGREGLKFESIK
jgi:hypothetical protein